MASLIAPEKSEVKWHNFAAKSLLLSPKAQVYGAKSSAGRRAEGIKGRHAGERGYPAIPDRVVLSNSFHDVAKKPRATIDVACVNLKKLGAGFEFLTGGLCIENSAGSDHGDFGFCENAAHQRG
jgi:hypothetical protein